MADSRWDAFTDKEKALISLGLVSGLIAAGDVTNEPGKLIRMATDVRSLMTEISASMGVDYPEDEQVTRYLKILTERPQG